MNRIFYLSFLLFAHFASSAQGKSDNKPTSFRSVSQSKPGDRKPLLGSKKINFNGQWKGGFTDNSSPYMGFNNDKIDYVLELEVSGHFVNGYSYTYFYEGTKRFYTICKLTGTINNLTKEVTVTEYERTKFNTPADFRNCFQIHKLKYEKVNGDTEQLVGRWYPAPDQTGDCGFGSTVLSRPVIRKHYSNPIVTAPVKKDQKQQTITAATHKKQKPAISVNPPKDSVAVTKKDTIATSDPDHGKAIVPKADYENRTNDILKKIDIEHETITVDFYDDGEVDGDSISVYFNGEQIIQHLMLTEKAATFKLTIDKSRPYNELVMYAENLGTLPPNTALMIVNDGEKQYHIRITSDTQRNGTIDFHFKGKK